jgi:hypothetical protein
MVLFREPSIRRKRLVYAQKKRDGPERRREEREENTDPSTKTRVALGGDLGDHHTGSSSRILLKSIIPVPPVKVKPGAVQTGPQLPARRP